MYVVVVAHSPGIWASSSLLCWPFGALCREPLDFSSLTGSLFWTYPEKNGKFHFLGVAVRAGSDLRCGPGGASRFSSCLSTNFADLQWCLFLHFVSTFLFFVLFFLVLFFWGGLKSISERRVSAAASSFVAWESAGFVCKSSDSFGLINPLSQCPAVSPFAFRLPGLERLFANVVTHGVSFSPDGSLQEARPPRTIRGVW